MKHAILLLTALFGLPALVACGGGGGFWGLGPSGGPLLELDNDETYPRQKLSGSGRVGNPYKLPDKHPAGLTAGIKDFLLADNRAYIWEVPVRSDDGFAMGEGPYPLLFLWNDGLIFNAPGDGWFQLSKTSTDASRPGWRLRGDCVVAGPEICDSYFSKFPPDFSAGGNYGTFEIRTRDDDDRAKQIESLAVRAYTWGLPTPADVMPHSGSAQYTGPFKGIFGHEDRTDPLDPATVTKRDFYEADATITAGVTFTSGGGSITLSTGAGLLSPLKSNTEDGAFDFSVGGSVSGNTFTGSGTINVSAGGATYHLTNGTYTGGFYGPATGPAIGGTPLTMPEEMVGTLYADEGLADPANVLVGGFHGTVQP
ncbi:MAG: transferrin-binding protein-like solute binding protein [Alphaproteobacteria bacterium]|nr:transferrin-binding protein-like solute binding protein [Alphaproteobacteria bacterium]